MSYFNLTQLGYQNTITKTSFLAQECPIRSTTEFNFRALPPIVDRNMPPKSIVPLNQISSYPPGPRGSRADFATIRMKHIRNPKAPFQLHRLPVTTSFQYGWFLKEDPIKQTLPWTHTPRYPQINSEMTRFVEKMAMTNREFTLF
ncbi:testis-expressed protein 49-like [Gigantopelta aegis]|uniref:testis-expressed protein 49-like n=1 Tax=Gigantopelta aegis TaxID=1735272 RepID=UPI001B889A30|nr:testis-expressed protein 49-like [Gigantopelta aegis]